MNPTPRLLRTLVFACAAWCAAPGAAFAAIAPNIDRQVQLTAREQPIAAFLQDLFGLVDLPVSVSPSVKGAVNGTFSGEADRVARNVARAFGLVMYFDGTVMHVYTAAELGARTLPTTPAVADKVVRAAAEMQLTDPRNTLRTTRDGAVVVRGTRRFIEQVEELARASQVSQAVQPPLGFKVFYLRYAWAHDVVINFGGRQVVVPGVATTIRSLVTSSPRSQASLAAQDLPAPNTLPHLKGQGLIRTQGGAQPTLGLPDAGARAGTADVLMAAYGGGAGVAVAPGGGLVPVAAGNPSLVLGDLQQVRIEADKRLNAVIVRDAPDRLAHYEQLVKSLDVEPQSIEIEATIIDVNTEKLRELGVNWRASIEGRSSVLVGNGTASDLLLQPGGGVVGSAITPVAAGGAISAVIGNAAQFVARITALQTEGAARVVSSPQVVTLSNVEAVFDSSSTFYVRVAGREEVDLFNVSAGTSLRVTPHVFKDAEGVRIKMLVAVEDGSVTGQQVDAIPVVHRASINTQAMIYEGESLLIGGLTRDSSGSGVEKVPFFGDIPVLGHLFRTDRSSGERVERMFLISPRLSARRSAAFGAKPAAPAAPAPAPDPTPTPAPDPTQGLLGTPTTSRRALQ